MNEVLRFSPWFAEARGLGIGFDIIETFFPSEKWLASESLSYLLLCLCGSEGGELLLFSPYIRDGEEGGFNLCRYSDLRFIAFNRVHAIIRCQCY